MWDVTGMVCSNVVCYFVGGGVYFSVVIADLVVSGTHDKRFVGIFLLYPTTERTGLHNVVNRVSVISYHSHIAVDIRIRLYRLIYCKDALQPSHHAHHI